MHGDKTATYIAKHSTTCMRIWKSYTSMHKNQGTNVKSYHAKLRADLSYVENFAIDQPLLSHKSKIKISTNNCHILLELQKYDDYLLLIKLEVLSTHIN